MTTIDGPKDPMTVNDGPKDPMTVNDGPKDPMTAEWEMGRGGDEETGPNVKKLPEWQF